MRLVDLGMVIAEAADDHSVRKIERWGHADGPSRLQGIAGEYLETLAMRENWQTVPRIDTAFPEEGFLSNDVVTLTVHAGTHVDAPWHYGPTCEGAAAPTISDLAIDRFFGRGMKLTLRGLNDSAPITRQDIEVAIERTGKELSEIDIVLIETGWDANWPSTSYFDGHPGMTVEALDVLLDAGVHLIGIDTAGFDLPAPVMIAAFGRSGDRAHLWPCHLHGRRREYLQIERLANLAALPATGFWVLCPPVAVKGASGGWTRPVALVSDGDNASDCPFHDGQAHV